MELKDLAAKQKRLLSWTEFLKNNVIDQELLRQTNECLKEYSNVLARIWEHESFSPEDALRLNSLERKLEDFNESARLAAG